jgi:hypothetical protein
MLTGSFFVTWVAANRTRESQLRTATKDCFRVLIQLKHTLFWKWFFNLSFYVVRVYSCAAQGCPRLAATSRCSCRW